MKHKALPMAVIFIMLFSVGCNSKNGVPFTDLVQGEVIKINMRHPGSGILYSTTDEKLIKRFITVMEDGGGDYYESDPVGLVGNTVYRLYDAENTELATIEFIDKGKVQINGKAYILKNGAIEGLLKPFFEEFNSDKNIVKE